MPEKARNSLRILLSIIQESLIHFLNPIQKLGGQQVKAEDDKFQICKELATDSKPVGLAAREYSNRHHHNPTPLQ